MLRTRVRTAVLRPDYKRPDEPREWNARLGSWPACCNPGASDFEIHGLRDLPMRNNRLQVAVEKYFQEPDIPMLWGWYLCWGEHRHAEIAGNHVLLPLADALFESFPWNSYLEEYIIALKLLNAEKEIIMPPNWNAVRLPGLFGNFTSSPDPSLTLWGRQATPGSTSVNLAKNDAWNEGFIYFLI